MISDEEIRQSAWAVKAHFGDGAIAHARGRIEQLRAGEDEAGAEIWEKILRAIEAMGHRPPSGDRGGN